MLWMANSPLSRPAKQQIPGVPVLTFPGASSSLLRRTCYLRQACSSFGHGQDKTMQNQYKKKKKTLPRRGLQVDPEPESRGRQKAEAFEQKEKRSLTPRRDSRGPGSDGRVCRGQDFIQIRVLNVEGEGAEWVYMKKWHTRAIRPKKSSLNRGHQHDRGLGSRAWYTHFFKTGLCSLLGNLQADALQGKRPLPQEPNSQERFALKRFFAGPLFGGQVRVRGRLVSCRRAPKKRSLPPPMGPMEDPSVRKGTARIAATFLPSQPGLGRLLGQREVQAVAWCTYRSLL